MNRLERAAEREPGLYPFGTLPLESLSVSEEAVAEFEPRLRSVWKYVVHRAKRFCAKLSQREQAHLTPEDVVSETIRALLERDSKWDPDRGRYVTFVESVMRNVLAESRERARVVTAPANATGRLRRYRERFAAGVLPPESVITMHAIEAALGEPETVCAAADPAFHSPVPATEEEPAEHAWQHLADAIMSLDDPRQALAIGRQFGLFGSAVSPVSSIDPKKLQVLNRRARIALRKQIEKLREPQ